MSRNTFTTSFYGDGVHQVNYGTDRALGWWYDINRADLGKDALEDGSACVEEKSTVFDNLFGFKMFLRLLELGCKHYNFMYYAMLDDDEKAGSGIGVKEFSPIVKRVFETHADVIAFFAKRGQPRPDIADDFLKTLVGSSVLLLQDNTIIGYLEEEQEAIFAHFMSLLGYQSNKDLDGNIVYVPKQEEHDDD